MSARHSTRAMSAGFRLVGGGICSGLLALVCAAGQAAIGVSAQSHAPSPAPPAPYASKLSQPKYKLVVDKDVKIRPGTDRT